jgi:hypothetical protein
LWVRKLSKTISPFFRIGRENCSTYAKCLPIHRTIHDIGRGHAFKPQGGDERQGLPLPRLLEGCDFVIAITPTGMDVVTLRQSASADVVPARMSAQASAPAAPVTPAGQPTYRERD